MHRNRFSKQLHTGFLDNGEFNRTQFSELYLVQNSHFFGRNSGANNFYTQKRAHLVWRAMSNPFFFFHATFFSGGHEFFFLRAKKKLKKIRSLPFQKKSVSPIPCWLSVDFFSTFSFQFLEFFCSKLAVAWSFMNVILRIQLQ